MTVTRNQRDNTEQLSTTGPKGTLQPSQRRSEVVPTWAGLLTVLAQDKRHDLAEPTIRFWKAKLAKYSDDIVRMALMEGRWEFFPSVDQVITEIERIQADLRQERANEEWEHWKSENVRAEQEGLLASEEDYAQMNAGIKKLAGLKSMDAAVFPSKPPVIPTTAELAEHLKKHREVIKAAGLTFKGMDVTK